MLSLVMPSWAVTPIAMICMLTLTTRSKIGLTRLRPGSIGARTLPRRNTTPRSYCWITRRPRPTNVPTARTNRAPTTIDAASISPTPLTDGRQGRHLQCPSVGRGFTPGRRRGNAAGSLAGVTADFAGVRLHVVTGKGGTGKTTIAAALALALAGHGRNVLLV